MSNGPVETTEDAISDSSKRPAVVASFSGYTPPFDPVPIVEIMLASVPIKHLMGLKEIVLTNSSSLPRKRRRSVTKSRKHKVRIERTGGLYHPAWNGNRAWIEIFVDNTLKNWEQGWWLKLRFMRESLLGDTLFHEIGHHIHATVQREFREKEDVADSWKARLRRQYNRAQHPWQRALLHPFRPIIIALGKAASRQLFKKGLISSAELKEDLKESVSPKK